MLPVYCWYTAISPYANELFEYNSESIISTFISNLAFSVWIWWLSVGWGQIGLTMLVCFIFISHYQRQIQMQTQNIMKFCTSSGKWNNAKLKFWCYRSIYHSGCPLFFCFFFFLISNLEIHGHRHYTSERSFFHMIFLFPDGGYNLIVACSLFLVFGLPASIQLLLL